MFVFIAGINPTWINGIQGIIVVKNDEDVDLGYHYTVTVGGVERLSGWFDGFGCEERPNDVTHAIRRLVA